MYVQCVGHGHGLGVEAAWASMVEMLIRGHANDWRGCNTRLQKETASARLVGKARRSQTRFGPAPVGPPTTRSSSSYRGLCLEQRTWAAKRGELK